MEFTPLSGAIGVEISGIDLANLKAGQADAILDAYEEHLLMLFRGQDVPPAQQVEFTEIFGTPLVHPLQTRASVDGHPEVLILENRPGRKGARNDYWHSDISHMEAPPSASILQALTVPTGHGDTMFCNMVKAFHDLSDGMKKLLSGRRALHSGMATYLRSLESTDARTIEISEVAPPVAHPVVRAIPDTNQHALFVNPHFTSHFEDLTEEESAPILDMLGTFATRPENVYRHRWQAGDVLVWDNRRTMHYAVLDYTEDMPRKMHHTTAAGERPI